MAADRIQIRRDTAANWTSSNPVLTQGEIGLETNTKNFKVGDGATLWTNLPYWIVGYDGNPVTVSQDSTHRFATDSEKSTWNGKQDALGFTPVNTTDARLSDARTPTSHTHPQSEITNLVSALAAKAASSHTHAQSDVTNLASALAAKTDLTIIDTQSSSYSTLLSVSCSHTAAKVAGTYALSHGDVAAIGGTGTLYPIVSIYIAASDYPTINGKAPKLRIRSQLYTNDVAPTGNFTFGLYPITRPATSGGAGLCIYTIGTVVSGSNGASFTIPAADSLLNAVGSDFALPNDGHYILAVVTTSTIATSAHLHMSASLQLHNA